MDIADICRVVQYMVPKTLSEWTQHSGHSGCNGEPAVAVLLTEPSVFQKVKSRKKKATTTYKRSIVTKQNEVTIPSVQIAIKKEEQEPVMTCKHKHRSAIQEQIIVKQEQEDSDQDETDDRQETRPV